MMKENKLGRLDEKCIRVIHDVLNAFEREHSGETNFLGEELIKEEYTKRLIR